MPAGRFIILLLNALAGRCHPVAGDNLELGFVSSLALQNLSVEYFGQAYVRPSQYLPSSPPLARAAAADIGRGGLAAFTVLMQDTHLGKA
jgi:hypothetical protein